jgi:hypothetical protein
MMAAVRAATRAHGTVEDWYDTVAVPEVGNPLGAAVLCAGNLVDEATLIRYADPERPGRSRTALWASLTTAGVARLQGRAKKHPPIWPVPAARHGVATWDGQTIGGSATTKACPVPQGMTATWETRAGRGLIAIVGTDGEVDDPLQLAAALVTLGLTTGPASSEEIEERWLAFHLNPTDPARAPLHQLIEEVASALGYQAPAELVVADGWDPEPHGGKGWFTWHRLSSARPGAVELLSEMVLVHRVTGANRPGGSLYDIFSSGGVLQAPVRRRLSGIAPGLGVNETQQAEAGLDDRVCCELADRWPDSIGPALVWDDPVRLLSRLDWVGLPPRHVDIALGRKQAPRRNWRDEAVTGMEAVAAMGDGTEIVFRNGLDLVGAEAPTRIICRTYQERREILDVLARLGVTELAGRPVDTVVKHRTAAWAR